MRSIYLLLTLFLVASAAKAQNDATGAPDHTIDVTAQGEVEIPADIIQFNIDLNAEAESPQEAYELHKKREKVLVQLLDKYQVREDQIHFQPVSIHKNTGGNYRTPETRNQEETYRTSQQVNLTLKDFEAYEKIQVTLIQHGFDNFSGNFRSSRQTEGEEKALRNAIEEARKKAEIIASAAGINLGEIKQIRYSHHQYVPFRQMESMAVNGADQQSLLKYEQSVLIQTAVTIQFHFNP